MSEFFDATTGPFVTAGRRITRSLPVVSTNGSFTLTLETDGGESYGPGIDHVMGTFMSATQVVVEGLNEYVKMAGDELDTHSTTVYSQVDGDVSMSATIEISCKAKTADEVVELAEKFKQHLETCMTHTVNASPTAQDIMSILAASLGLSPEDVVQMANVGQQPGMMGGQQPADMPPAAAETSNDGLGFYL